MCSLGRDINKQRDQLQSTGGGRLALLSSAPLLSLCVSVHVFVCRFTKTGVIFGDATTSDPDILNWGKGRAALNVIHFDSSACAGTTHIKSAC